MLLLQRMKHSSGVFNPRESVRVSSDAGCGARKVGGGGREGGRVSWKVESALYSLEVRQSME